MDFQRFSLFCCSYSRSKFLLLVVVLGHLASLVGALSNDFAVPSNAGITGSISTLLIAKSDDEHFVSSLVVSGSWPTQSLHAVKESIPSSNTNCKPNQNFGV